MKWTELDRNLAPHEYCEYRPCFTNVSNSATPMTEWPPVGLLGCQTIDANQSPLSFY